MGILIEMPDMIVFVYHNSEGFAIFTIPPPLATKQCLNVCLNSKIGGYEKTVYSNHHRIKYSCMQMVSNGYLNILDCAQYNIML